MILIFITFTNFYLTNRINEHNNFVIVDKEISYLVI